MNPLLMPVVAAQGILVRSRTERLPQASGATTGVVHSSGDGSGTPVRIAVVGESTAAGCGAATHDEAMAGALSRELAERTGRPVAWSVTGQNSATARRIRYRLLPEVGTGFDTAVLMAGVNDVLGRTDPADWRNEITAIVTELSTRAARVAVTGIPPFGIFPGLPGVLSRYLGAHAERLNDEARQVCAEHPGAVWVDATSLLPVSPDFFARDRFHPSPAGYRRWAAVIAAQVSPQAQPGAAASGT